MNYVTVQFYLVIQVTFYTALWLNNHTRKENYRKYSIVPGIEDNEDEEYARLMAFELGIKHDLDPDEYKCKTWFHAKRFSSLAEAHEWCKQKNEQQ